MTPTPGVGSTGCRRRIIDLLHTNRGAALGLSTASFVLVMIQMISLLMPYPGIDDIMSHKASIRR